MTDNHLPRLEGRDFLNDQHKTEMCVQLGKVAEAIDRGEKAMSALIADADSAGEQRMQVVTSRGNMEVFLAPASVHALLSAQMQALRVQRDALIGGLIGEGQGDQKTNGEDRAKFELVRLYDAVAFFLTKGKNHPTAKNDLGKQFTATQKVLYPQDAD